MVYLWATRIVALAIFLAIMYGVSELAHAVVARGFIAWLVAAAAVAAFIVWVDDWERQRDGRPRTSWQTLRADIWGPERWEWLTPVCFWGAVIGLILLFR
jgi:hypothetical protein